MLHDPKPQVEHFSYEDVNEWWRGKGTCINGSWRKFQKALDAAAAREKAEKEKAAANPAASPSANSNEVEKVDLEKKPAPSEANDQKP